MHLLSHRRKSPNAARRKREKIPPGGGWPRPRGSMAVTATLTRSTAGQWDGPACGKLGWTLCAGFEKLPPSIGRRVESDARIALCRPCAASPPGSRCAASCRGGPSRFALCREAAFCATCADRAIVTSCTRSASRCVPTPPIMTIGDSTSARGKRKKTWASSRRARMSVSIVTGRGLVHWTLAPIPRLFVLCS